jgi:hypothetical protein
MDALKLFWFFEPRMALWGLGLGAGLGAMYGLFVGVFVPPLGLLFGPLIGGAYGAIAGLALGIMEGAVLWAITLLFLAMRVPERRGGINERRRGTLGYLLAQCTLVRGDGHGAR